MACSRNSTGVGPWFGPDEDGRDGRRRSVNGAARDVSSWPAP